MLRGDHHARRLAAATQTWVSTGGEHILINIPDHSLKARNVDAQLGKLHGSRTVVASTHDPDRLALFATSRVALAA